METNNKSAKKVYNIFKNAKISKELQKVRNAGTPKFNANLPAGRSARLETENFPPESSVKDVYGIKNQDFEDSELIFTQQNKMPTSSCFQERIDKLFNKHGNLSGERSTNSSLITKHVEKNSNSITNEVVSEVKKNNKNSGRANNDLDQIKKSRTSADISKNKQNDSKYMNIFLLAKGRKSKLSTSQTMTSSSSTSICDKACNLKNETFLSEKLQENITNEISVPLETSPRKRDCTPTVCKIKFDDLTKKNIGYSEPRKINTRRFTICNSSLEKNTTVSEGIEPVAEFNRESQNDLEKIIQNTKNYKFASRNKKLSELQKAKKTETSLDSASQISSNELQKIKENAKSDSPKSVLRESARIKKRRLTISNTALTRDDFKATKTLDYMEFPRKRTICKETLKNDLQISGVMETRNISDSYNPSDAVEKNVNANNKAVIDLQGKKEKSSTERVLKEKEDTHVAKRIKGGQRSDLKSPKLISNKPRKEQIRKTNVSKVSKNTYNRISKENLSSVNIRKIPQDRLDDVLGMLANEDHPFWHDGNISCNAGIHRYWETRPMISDQNMKMKYARQFLLRREWLSLSKVLCLSSQDTKHINYYPLLVKYATLCLAYTDKEKFNKFIKSLISMGDSNTIIKKCTKISRKNEE